MLFAIGFVLFVLHILAQDTISQSVPHSTSVVDPVWSWQQDQDAEQEGDEEPGLRCCHVLPIPVSECCVHIKYDVLLLVCRLLEDQTFVRLVEGAVRLHLERAYAKVADDAANEDPGQQDEDAVQSR